MTGSIPEHQAERQEVFHPRVTPGIARFLVAAGGDIHAKRFFNPAPLTDPQQLHDVHDALRDARSTSVDIPLIGALSTNYRQALGNQEKLEGRDEKTQLQMWAEGMARFLQRFDVTASNEAKALLKNRLLLGLEKGPPDYWNQAHILWSLYMAEGSNIKAFLNHLLGDIAGTSPEAIVQRQQRITSIEPLLGMFGDERMGVLIRDAFHATSLLKSTSPQKDQVLQIAVTSLQQDFATPLEASAYHLLWNTIKDEIPPQEPPSTPPTQDTSQPPPHPDTPSVAPTSPPPDSGDSRQFAPEEVRRNGRESGESLRKPILTAAIVIPSPDHPWRKEDAVIAGSLGDKGFFLGAFDGMDKGGTYSGELAQTVKMLTGKKLGSFTDIPSVESALRAEIDTVSEAVATVEHIKQGAAQDIASLHVGEREKKQLLDNIGTTGLLAMTAEDEGRPVLAILNLGHSRLIRYNPTTGEVRHLTIDQTVGARKFRLRLTQTEEEAFLDTHRAQLSHFVKPNSIEEVEQRLEQQAKHGWSKKDELLRVIPLDEHALYFALTNGVTYTIAPWDLPGVVQNAYRKSLTQGEVDIKKVVRYIAQEAQKRMQNPKAYKVTIRGKPHEYVVKDDIGVAAVWYS